MNTNLVNELTGLMSQNPVMAKDAVEGVARNLMGEYGWLFICGFIALMAKDILMNFVQGVLVFWGSSWKNDEILYLHGRQARLIRKGFLNSTFQMADRSTILIIPNSQLRHVTVERRLPNGDQPDYLPKGSELLGPMEVSVVEKTPRATRKKR